MLLEVTVFFLVKDVFGHNDRNVPLLPAILVDCDILFTPESTRLAVPASQSHVGVCPHATVMLDLHLTCRNATCLMSRGSILMTMALR